ncbi:LysR family transcriptional regulator [Sodalis ligni]|uniref:DNA-binding transcriptional LysR family regulator n=1 Tax=Sodalis ligni TaxID=2697027 RepID=A0A4R1NEF9_9GAMM|nr:LysR family transcriptional regulator [Sodalis ligni]TCL05852.1 DNA-binding transcriptional LysR family regulator [Sodalis ligni]
MELRHLRYFLAIAQTENVRLAAEQLHVTQPALSRQLKDLEDELGMRLFERLPRGIHLNAAGKAYAQEVQRILADLDSAGERTRRIAAGEAGRIRLGFLEIAAWRGIMPDVISAFSTACPDIGMELIAGNTPQQLEMMLADTLDGGFIYLFNPLEDPLTGLALRRDNVVLAAPSAWGHRFAESVAARDLKGVPYIGFPRAGYPAYFDQLLSACRAAGFSPDFVQTARDEGAVLSLVSAGIGVAIVNSFNLSRPLPQVDYLPLTDISVPLPLYFVWRRRHLNPALDRFVELVAQHVAEDAGKRH